METIDTTTAPTATLQPSTLALLSLDLSKLRALIIPSGSVSDEVPPYEAEDETYLSVAMGHLQEAKDAKRAGDYPVALKQVHKAVQRVTELVKLREEQGLTEYKVLQAPFIYQQGNILTAYIEDKADVFGNIPDLNIDFSENEESEGEDD
jgi:hypothetical protein